MRRTTMKLGESIRNTKKTITSILFLMLIIALIDQNKEEAITVLIEAIKDGGHHTHVLPPIMLKR